MEKTLAAIAAISAVFLLQPVLPMEHVISARPWNILFHWLFHSSFRHLAYNMIPFFMFGSIAEKDTGRLYVPFLLSSAAISGIAASLVYASFLGFSGVVYALIGYVSARKPLLMVPAFSVPMPLVVASAMWIMQDTAGLFLNLGGIAYASHLAGFFYGLAVGVGTSLINMKPSAGEVEGPEASLPREDGEDLGLERSP